MPATFARVNDLNEVQEIRTFTDEEFAVAKATGFTIPQDAPHKGVRWLPYVEVGRDSINHVTQDAVVSERVTADAFEIVFTPVDKDPQPYRDHVIADLRRTYRDRIVDALPDMKAVAALVAERDAAIVAVGQETDIVRLTRSSVNVAAIK